MSYFEDSLGQMFHLKKLCEKEKKAGVRRNELLSLGKPFERSHQTNIYERKMDWNTKQLRVINILSFSAPKLIRVKEAQKSTGLHYFWQWGGGEEYPNEYDYDVILNK